MVCAGKNAVFVVYDGRDTFAGRVIVRNTLCIHNCFGFLSHFRQQHR